MEVNPEDLGAVVNPLRRAEGQIGAVLPVVQQGRDRKDIVTQLVAVDHRWTGLASRWSLPSSAC